ncbi:MAG: 50S ribosomal protein L9 [Candidatus Taylorbacteria bacterium CG11_big_fil_rev_8_21_14_0_20_46_11]|uniref:Large ribosomal subunit protein bL9 n=1 Tax=Candidatus Taylorbacteria bacterium CG11_big_fil_rev_8_21_14_0_20_46_11 TaxID=1975025 RepID=A0A2H0KAG0_9BACT|nr:MAG: 50S ribosomal protein L9 [Candidatus Taylorbacteria bacterium CG11_big_fil_rev_8_21_14_0_20_46_11]
MKIVLLKDVKGVGRKYDIKSVSDGYALNFLIPKRLAEVGTASALGRAERHKSEESATKKVHEDLLSKNIKSLEGVMVEMSGKANDKGHLFASIHGEAICKALKDQKGIDVLPEFLVLEKPVKEVGDHVIPVEVQDKKGAFTLTVKASE